MSSLGDPDPAEHLPLSEQAFHVLLAVSDADRHGYGIMQDVEQRTRGEVRLGAGTLYGLLKRLLSGGLITEVDDPRDRQTGDERRRYYRLTPLGAAVLQLEIRRLEDLVRQARRRRESIEAGARTLKPRRV